MGFEYLTSNVLSCMQVDPYLMVHILMNIGMFKHSTTVTQIHSNLKILILGS